VAARAAAQIEHGDALRALLPDRLTREDLLVLGQQERRILLRRPGPARLNGRVRDTLLHLERIGHGFVEAQAFRKHDRGRTHGVCRGIETVDKIVSAPRDRNDRPNEPTRINRITVQEK